MFNIFIASAMRDASGHEEELQQALLGENYTLRSDHDRSILGDHFNKKVHKIGPTTADVEKCDAFHGSQPVGALDSTQPQPSASGGKGVNLEACDDCQDSR